ncbi:MAG: ACP S-malonyltransferase [Candidatus Omnitrophica bacterium]|nr:ACP S-malonyltransferase [Candidatus Omnitrophota bacterium]
MELIYLFPGQGAQYVGMGQTLYLSSLAARRTLDEANKILGYSLTDLCFNGPAGELERTEKSQPAIYAVSMAALAAVQEVVLEQNVHQQWDVLAAAGLSLGEYSALAAAGSFTFEEGLKLVAERGRLMDEASRINPGAMSSILNLDPQALEKICWKTGVQVANLNCPGQVVISGSVEGIEEAEAAAKEAGARRAIRLEVSGAFHSKLMEPAAKGLAGYLSEMNIEEPGYRVYSNVTAGHVTGAEAVRKQLVAQLTSPTLWEDTVKKLAADFPGALMVELGPGKVLQGLCRRIDKGINVKGVDAFDDLQSLLQQAGVGAA